MISAVLQPEINNLENQSIELHAQLAAIQSQLAAIQTRILELSKCESEIQDLRTAAQRTIDRISALAPSAIAGLKASLLSLFDSNLGEPISNKEAELKPLLQEHSAFDESVNLGVQTEDSDKRDTLLKGETCPIDPDAHWVSSQPDGSSWELATPLCCLLEDCPSESLQSQAIEIACWYAGVIKPLKLLYKSDAYEEWATEEAASKEPPAYLDFVKLGDNIGYLCDRDGQIYAVYAGGSSKRALKQWGDFLTHTNGLTRSYELRQGKRLGTKWELKLTPMHLKQIELLSQCDFAKDPRSAAAPANRPELAAGLEQQAQEVIASIEPATTTIATVRRGADASQRVMQMVLPTIDEEF